MPNVGTISIGGKLEYKVGSSWVEVANCKSITLPAFMVGQVSTDSLSNTDFAKTYKPGMVDGDTVSAEVAHTGDVYQRLHGLLRDMVEWRVTTPEDDADTPLDVVCEYEGFITGMPLNMSGPEDEMMISLSIKVSGLPTITVA